MLPSLIQQLGKDLRRDLTSSTDGVYLINFEPDIQVRISKEEAFIILRTSVGKALEKETEKQMQYFLSSNLFGRETGSAFLGLDKEGKEVILSRRLFNDASYEQFHVALEELVNYAECWKSEIK